MHRQLAAPQQKDADGGGGGGAGAGRGVRGSQQRQEPGSGEEWGRREGSDRDEAWRRGAAGESDATRCRKGGGAAGGVSEGRARQQHLGEGGREPHDCDRKPRSARPRDRGRGEVRENEPGGAARRRGCWLAMAGRNQVM